MNYMVLESDSAMKMMSMVQDACRDGWRVSGGIAVTSESNNNKQFYQSMVYTEQKTIDLTQLKIVTPIDIPKYDHDGNPE